MKKMYTSTLRFHFLVLLSGASAQSDNTSDIGRNIIFILTGIGSAVCLGIIICCLLKRRRSHRADMHMDILPKSQRLIENSPNTSYPRTLTDSTRLHHPSHAQPLLGQDSSQVQTAGDRQGADTNVFHEAITDMGTVVLPAQNINQGRVRTRDNVTDPPPSYTSLFSPPN